MESLNNTVNKSLSFLDNEYINAGLTLVLILYASRIAPKLPKTVSNWFKNDIVKFLLFFLIVFLNKKDAKVALATSVTVMVILLVVGRLTVDENMENVGSVNCDCQCNCPYRHGHVADDVEEHGYGEEDTPEEYMPEEEDMVEEADMEEVGMAEEGDMEEVGMAEEGDMEEVGMVEEANMEEVAMGGEESRSVTTEESVSGVEESSDNYSELTEEGCPNNNKTTYRVESYDTPYSMHGAI
jgi:hypothetical protein